MTEKLEAVLEAAKAVVREAIPIAGAGGQRWTELDNKTFDDLKAAVEACE